MNSFGKELMQKGFRITLDKEYDGAVYEILKKLN
jgi:hypothetical protein